MNGSKLGSRKSRRRIKVAPVTRAIRTALAASATAFALFGAPPALAGDCSPIVDGTIYCEGDFLDGLVFNEVFDLTVVFDDPETSPDFGVTITPPDGEAGVYANIDGAFSLAAYGYIGTVGASAITAYATGPADVDLYGTFHSEDANAIDVASADDASVLNEAGSFVVAYSGGADVSAIRVETFGDDTTASITNGSGAVAYALNEGAGFAVGLYGYAAAGDVAIDNDGIAVGVSLYGIADGIFASGENVGISNSGSAIAHSSYWGAGIQAYATDGATIANAGLAYASVDGFYGHAYGIHVAGGDGGLSIDNSGGVIGAADYAYGVFAQASGPIGITNSGDVIAAPYSGTYGLLATGIRATTSGSGADIVIDNDNDGFVYAAAMYGGTGIEALALGEGASAHVGNSGGIVASQFSIYGYGANGIVASANLDASIDNSGSIDVESGGLGYGAMALAFNGEASVTNSGDIDVYALGIGYTGAYGVVASSSNGTAVVDNSGTISVASAYYGHGIDASGTAGVTVTNSGYVTSDAWIGYGILATAGNGDASVTNTEDGLVAAYYSSTYYYGLAIGIAGISTAGDVDVQNDGRVYASIVGRSIGAAAIAPAGDANLGNTGLVDAYSLGTAVGGLVRAEEGVANFDNSGLVQATSIAEAAFGAQVLGTVAEADNTGTILATGNGTATGILARGSGSATVSNDGEIAAYAEEKYGQAIGIYASGYVDSDHYAGDVSVSVGADGQIAAIAQYGVGFGVFGYSGTGDVSIGNDGVVYAGGAVAGFGLYAATGGDIAMENTGIISAGGALTAGGMSAQSVYGDITLANGGSVGAASLLYGSTGMDAYSIYGDVELRNDGTIDVSSVYDMAIGMYAYSMYGAATVANDGTISAFSEYGLADGIFASGADVAVSTGEDSAISADGYAWAAGIEAEGSDSTTVDNAGAITVGAYDSAMGIYATAGEGGLAIGNSGAISAIGYYSTGIEATTGGDGTISSSGDIVAGALYTVDYYGTTYVYGSATATGIRLLGGGVDAGLSVANSGSITADSYFGGSGIEVVAVGAGGTASASNSGDIAVGQYSKYGYGAGGIVASADADATVTNTGSITALSGGAAYGALGLSFNGEASVTNAGDITVESAAFKYYGAYGVLAGSANGTALAGNTGSIDVFSPYLAVGVYAQGTAGATATSSGDIMVDSFVDGTGLRAESGGGDALAANSGDIDVVAFYGYGVASQSTLGDAIATNEGDVAVDAYVAYGMFALSSEGDAAAINKAGGTIHAGYAYYDYGEGIAFGAAAISEQGDAAAVNVGSIHTLTGNQTYALAALSLQGDATAYNSGDVEANSYADSAAGAFARADAGTATVANSGSLAAESGWVAYGMLAVGDEAVATNSGDIAASGFIVASGIRLEGTSEASLSNSGDIAVEAFGYAYGALLATYGVDDYGYSVPGDGTLSLDNSGSIQASAYGGSAYGVSAATYGGIGIASSGSISAESTYGAAVGIRASGETIAIANNGDIAAAGYGDASGIRAFGDDVSVANAGDIEATADWAYGVRISGASGDMANSGHVTATGTAYAVAVSLTGDSLAATNSGTLAAVAEGGAVGASVDAYADMAFASSGTISAQSDAGFATGLLAYSSHAGASAANSGTISATGVVAYGAVVGGGEGASFANSGAVDASGDDYAMGVLTGAYDGDAAVQNSGTIHADASALAVGVGFVYAGDATLANSGTIAASGAGDGNVAVLAGPGTTLSITNTGTITGAVVGGDGDDAIDIGQNGKWNVANRSTDFGGGDDVLHNLAGGTVALSDGAIYFGAGAGNSFVNEGTITVSGDSAIHMSGSSSYGFGTLALGIAPLADPPAPFMNDGIIDFSDGDTADILTIVGDFGGEGEITLDMNLLNGASDLLYIDGDVVDGTQQTVNLALTDIGDVTNPTPAQFLSVTGSVADGAFVPGQVTGFGSGNFIDLDVTLTPSVVAGATVFSASVAVGGLNGSGILAANIAPGAQALIASSIGTLRQRNGALAPIGDYGLNAWVRYFDNDGDIEPAHTVSIGTAGDFGFSQSNRGTEFGLGVDFEGPLAFGILLGDAKATQRLHDRTGTDHLKLRSVGLYGSWTVPAFYVDASYRWMSFDARLESAGGEQLSGGGATAFNLEAGYTGWSPGGFNVVPQVQYTASSLDNIDPVQGSMLDFLNEGGDSKRTRVGVEVNRAFQVGAATWMPYLAASSVHESDGKASYSVADVLSGTTDTSGSSTLLEAGVGVRFGGFRATIGANWADGGALDGVAGGQIVVRYSW